MKRFALILTLCGLLLSILGCKQAKEGPFTFTNKTGEKINVIITQDKTENITLDIDEIYTGKNYFVPTITFVKDFISEETIVDNRYVATTTNNFDYLFEKASSSEITISLSVPEDFTDTYLNYADWYIKEINGKLGDESNKTVKFSDFQTSNSDSDTEQKITLDTTVTSSLYTDTPEFKIYRKKIEAEKTTEENITSSFSIYLGQEDIFPSNDLADTPQTSRWNLKITYPKEEEVN